MSVEIKPAIVPPLYVGVLNLFNNSLRVFLSISEVKILLQLSLFGLQIALSERTIMKDCGHHFLIATSKLLRDQIRAANSQKLHSPDTEEEIGKEARRKKKKKCHDMTRGGEYPRGDR